MSKQKHNDLNHEQQQEAIQLYTEKRWSARKIADHLQANHSQIYTILKKNGVPFHRQPTATERKCKSCGVVKKIEEFPLQGKRKSNLRYYECLPCFRVKKDSAERDSYLQRKYGLTVTEYQELLELHGGVCAICKRADTKGRLSVDHDHQTGKVRGLLCRNHNVALGNFKDNVEHLQQAIKYLQERKQ